MKQSVFVISNMDCQAKRPVIADAQFYLLWRSKEIRTSAMIAKAVRQSAPRSRHSTKHRRPTDQGRFWLQRGLVKEDTWGVIAFTTSRAF
ncbi:MAG: hypothetical protein IPM27_10805 [Nitrosomonadales bacterium]|nr:hypothetical protein [Nitrosomonadales bacterium]